jgi:hypothetical protein
MAKRSLWAQLATARAAIPRKAIQENRDNLFAPFGLF